MLWAPEQEASWRNIIVGRPGGLASLTLRTRRAKGLKLWHIGPRVLSMNSTLWSSSSEEVFKCLHPLTSPHHHSHTPPRRTYNLQPRRIPAVRDPILPTRMPTNARRRRARLHPRDRLSRLRMRNFDPRPFVRAPKTLQPYQEKETDFTLPARDVRVRLQIQSVVS